MRLMKSMDPAFNREGFERDLREYIVPEVVDAYLSADQEALRAWCGEAVCALHFLFVNVLMQNARRTTCFGLQWRCSSAKVLLVTAKFSIFAKLMYGFISSLLTIIFTHSQVSDGKILENEVPVFIITFATQEVMLFRNAKTGEATVGAENKVEQCNYVAAITRVPEDLSNEITGGWKVIEVRSTLLYADFFFSKTFF
jgi:import inner membrane translocase subunit TIM44